MSDEWEASGFKAPRTNVGVTDKWEGEDEDEDDVKDCWDVDSEEERSKAEAAAAEAAKAKAAAAAAEPKKKKKLRDRMALLDAQGNEDDEDDDDVTPEAKLAEKLRLQKLEEANQLALTRDMLGLKTGSIDSMVPSTKEDFETFQKAVYEKVRFFSGSEHFQDLIEGMVKDLTLDMTLPTLKRAKIHVEGIHTTRLKEERSSKTKKKGGGKASLKNDLDKDLFGGGGGGEEQFDEMDDFM